LAVLALGWYMPAAIAKPPSLIAIEVYDGPSGPAYVQLSDVLINGKFEMRDCTPFQSASIDKSTYGKMQKILIAPGATLDRDSDGALRYRVGAAAALCVAPENIKYEHDAAY
jgi:hypothetical protein